VSRSVSITLTIHRPWHVSRMDVISAMLAGGWRADDHGQICYLPLGDRDDYDWQAKPLAESPRVLVELTGKDRAGEVLGLTVLWADTNVGGQLLYWTDGRLTLLVEINRRTLDGRVTDVSWYLAKLLPCIAAVPGAVIEALEWTEHV